MSKINPIENDEELQAYETSIKPPEISPEEYMNRPQFAPQTFWDLIENDQIKGAKIFQYEDDTVTTLKDLVDSGQELPETISILLPVKFVIPTKNIRQLDVAHAHELGVDITKNGQIYPCLGDLDEDGYIRIQAGLHRLYGVANVTDSEGDIKVDLITRTLTKQEQLQLKRRENLHKDMSTYEKYYVIATLYDLYIEQDDQPSKKGFAEFIGYSYDLVLKAIQYKTLPKIIREFVEKGCINATQALIIQRLKDPDKMVREAVYAINNNLKTELLDKRITNLIATSNTESLFGLGYMEASLTEGNNSNTTAVLKRKSMEIKSYYARMAQMIEILIEQKQTDKINISETGRKYLAEFTLSTVVFLSYLKEKDPKDYEKIINKTNRDIMKMIEFFNLYQSVKKLEEHLTRKGVLISSPIYRKRNLSMYKKSRKK